jgi:biopolymer transport protein ExbB
LKYKLEKNVSMATISGAGPMTGFLGTVVEWFRLFIRWLLLVGK